MMETYIVVNGNPVDGLTFFGIFSTAEDANEWGDVHLAGKEWWVAPLSYAAATRENLDLQSQ
jgi:hypothetical protein